MKIFNFAEIKEIEKPQTGEILLARGEDLYQIYNYRMGQVNPNDFFEQDQHRTMIEQVRAMNEADPRLSGMVDTRKLAILSFDRQIMGEGPEADFVREVFSGINNFNEILKQMLSAIECGFSVTEIIWESLNGKWIVKDLLPRCQDKFTFDKDWNLRLLTQGNIEGELLPDKKFLVFTWNGKYGNRFGTALYQEIYWYWYFKQNATKFWAIFTEKHGSPTTVGHLPKGIDKNDPNVTKISTFVTNLKNHQGIVLPEGFTIDLLEAARTGSIDTFEKFLNWLSDGMAIKILGQPGSTESSAGGSYAKVASQDTIRQDILKADIKCPAAVFNDQLIRWLLDFNFLNVKEYSKWQIIYEDKPDIKMLAEVTQILVNAGDDKIPISWIHKKIGIPELVEGAGGEMEPAFKRAAPVPMFPASVADMPIGDARSEVSGAQPVAEKVADASLNGAQISSLVEIITSAANQQLPLAAVMPILQSAFPNTPIEMLTKIVASLKGFTPSAPAAPPTFAETMFKRDQEIFLKEIKK